MTLKRVMVFIDGSNLYHALKDFVGCTDLDLGKLAQTLAGDISLGGTSRLSPNVIHGLPLA